MKPNKSIYETTVDGETIGFEFGMLASIHTEKASGQLIYEVFDGIAKSKLEPLLNYFYGGMVAYNELRGIKKDLTPAQVSRYIDAIGYEAALKIYVQSVKAYTNDETAKNDEAPMEAAGQNAA